TKDKKIFLDMCCHANSDFTDMCLMTLEDEDDSMEHPKHARMRMEECMGSRPNGKQLAARLGCSLVS
ncbi:hypothetical protein E2562_001927, partial [Oryza meyeriana var. granulata]